MSKIQTYAEWKDAVQRVFDQLRVVDIYLNEEGKERMAAMHTLLDLASFCDTSASLLAWIESREDMSEDEKQHLLSRHVKLPTRRLHDIVQESDGKAVMK